MMKAISLWRQPWEWPTCSLQA